MGALLSWLHDVEEVLKEKVFVTDVKSMEKNTDLYEVRAMGLSITSKNELEFTNLI